MHNFLKTKMIQFMGGNQQAYEEFCVEHLKPEYQFKSVDYITTFFDLLEANNNACLDKCVSGAIIDIAKILHTQIFGQVGLPQIAAMKLVLFADRLVKCAKQFANEHPMLLNIVLLCYRTAYQATNDDLCKISINYKYEIIFADHRKLYQESLNKIHNWFFNPPLNYGRTTNFNFSVNSGNAVVPSISRFQCDTTSLKYPAAHLHPIFSWERKESVSLSRSRKSYINAPWVSPAANNPILTNQNKRPTISKSSSIKSEQDSVTTSPKRQKF